MKKSRFSEEKIIAILKEGEAGVECHGAISQVWNQLRHAVQLEGKIRRDGRLAAATAEKVENKNSWLKKMYAELSLAHHARAGVN